MSKNRKKTSFVHIKDGIFHPVTRCKKSNKLFIIGTNEEVTGKVIPKERSKTCDLTNLFLRRILAMSGMIMYGAGVTFNKKTNKKIF